MDNNDDEKDIRAEIKNWENEFEKAAHIASDGGAGLRARIQKLKEDLEEIKQKKEGKRGPKRINKAEEQADETMADETMADETKATELCIPPPPPDKMLIFVKEGKKYLSTVEVKPSDTIADVKAELHATTYGNTPPDRQILVFDGGVLADERTLADYNIEHLSTLHMVVQIEARPFLRGYVPYWEP